MNQNERTDIGEMRGDMRAKGSDDPATIERDIEGTRDRMSRDIDAIGRKLSPRNLAAEARARHRARARRCGAGEPMAGGGTRRERRLARRAGAQRAAVHGALAGESCVRRPGPTLPRRGRP